MTIRQATAAIAYDDLAALLDDWQISLKAKGRRPGTISSYLTVARTFNAFLLTLAAQGSRPRCSDPIDHQRWTSDSDRPWQSRQNMLIV